MTAFTTRVYRHRGSRESGEQERDLLAEDAPGLWLAAVEEAAPSYPSAPDSLEVDVAVIGGGVTGLSAALHLKERKPELEVAVLERDRVGWGASGRSTGALTPLPELRWAAKLARDGLEETRRAGAFQAAGVAAVKELVARSEMDCRLCKPGYLMVGGAGHMAFLRREAQAMHAVGINAGHLVAREELQVLIEQRFWEGAVRSPASWVDPARYVAALAKLASDRGVRIYERSPVRRVITGARAELRLASGPGVHVPTVVVATDGYTPRIGLLRRYVYALHTCAVATEPLSNGALDSIGWQGREIIFEAGRTGHTFVLTPDNRLLCRGLLRYRLRDGLAPVDEDEIRRALGAAVEDRFPQLRPIEPEYAWDGVIGMTRSFRPAIGRLNRPGELLYAVGYSGHGLASGTLAGRLLAELHVGGRSPELEYALEHSLPKPMPTEPLRWLGFNAVSRWMSQRER